MPSLVSSAGHTCEEGSSRAPAAVCCVLCLRFYVSRSSSERWMVHTLFVEAPRRRSLSVMTVRALVCSLGNLSGRKSPPPRPPRGTNRYREWRNSSAQVSKVMPTALSGKVSTTTRYVIVARVNVKHEKAVVASM